MTSPSEPSFDRRGVIETLALASGDEVSRALLMVGEPTGWSWLRKPETGLVMVRGRAGGGGAPFNLGEATVTRASIALRDGTIGHAYALGRDKAKAKGTALLDALWQSGQRAAVETAILQPVRTRVADDRQSQEEEAAATTVDFFTMARETE